MTYGQVYWFTRLNRIKIFFCFDYYIFIHYYFYYYFFFHTHKYKFFRGETAIKLCKLQDMCCILSANEEEKLLRLHEKMGDLCSSLKAYPRAIDFYLKMLTVNL